MQNNDWDLKRPPLLSIWRKLNEDAPRGESDTQNDSARTEAESEEQNTSN